MKKIKVFLLMIVFLTPFGQLSAQSIDEELAWCYGVYGKQKNKIEVEKYAAFWPKDIQKTESFKKGQADSEKVSEEKQIECFENVYMNILTRYKGVEKANLSKPYCFGYLKSARNGLDYTDVFCQGYCEKNKQKTCLDTCKSGISSLSKKSNYHKGLKDGEIVDPYQFYQCKNVIKSMY
jgi:hypothetical protein